MNCFDDRLENVRKRVAEACARANRDPADVSILAVAKTRGPDEVREVADAGLTVIGENRIQEAKQKIPLCPGHLEWHMIGHLQRNKVRDAVRLFSMIHSVDSRRLAESINTACEAIGKVMPVCLEVNISGEGSKSGLVPGKVREFLEQCGALMNVDIIGLMTMPPFTEDPEDARPFFRQLRELRDECQSASGITLPELSMGMSNDFEVAIEEGATWVRLGTILFGERNRDRGKGLKPEG